MKLYYSKGACSLASRIIINEIGMHCDYVSVDLKEKKTETGKDFLAINPKGAVPTLETDEGEILTENAVIQQYLADKARAYQLLPAVGDFERYRVLEWVNFITTELHKSFGPLFNPKVSLEMRENLFIPLLKTKFSYIEKQLHSKNNLLGQFTLPDAYLFVMLLWASHFKFALNQWPNLLQYFKNLQKRQSIEKSLKEEGIRLPE